MKIDYVYAAGAKKKDVRPLNADDAEKRHGRNKR
jgi:hypothetical protein